MKKLTLLLLLFLMAFQVSAAVMLSEAGPDMSPTIKKEPIMDGGSGGEPILGPNGKPLKGGR